MEQKFCPNCGRLKWSLVVPELCDVCKMKKDLSEYRLPSYRYVGSRYYPEGIYCEKCRKIQTSGYHNCPMDNADI